MSGKSTSNSPRAGASAPRLRLETDNLPIASNDTPVKDAEAEAEAEDDEMDGGYTLSLREELELFGIPPPEPRGLPTGRPRRQLQTPVGFVPTTNDRYLNPVRERYVPHRDPNNSPFADIPFTAQTENYRAPRRRTSYSTIRRRPSAIPRPNGLPPLPRPLRYENAPTPRRRTSAAARTSSRTASASGAATSTSTSTTNPSSPSADTAKDSTIHPRRDDLV